MTRDAAASAPAASPRGIDAHTHFSSLKALDALEKENDKPFALGRTNGRCGRSPIPTRIAPHVRDTSLSTNA
jgi:hypothetical protein